MSVLVNDSRFDGIKPFEKKIWLASPTMHGEEQKWINDAFEKNWITTAGENINVIEKQVAEKIGRKQAVALSCGTAALHLAIRLAAEKLYGMPNGYVCEDGFKLKIWINNQTVKLHKGVLSDVQAEKLRVLGVV